MKEEVDKCFYRKSLFDLKSYNDTNFNLFDFEIGDHIELEYFKKHFDKIFNPKGSIQLKGSLSKNYLFIFEDNMFFHLTAAYPKAIKIEEGDDKVCCSLIYGKITMGELDNSKYEFLTPYVRKIKIKRFLKNK